MWKIVQNMEKSTISLTKSVIKRKKGAKSLIFYFVLKKNDFMSCLHIFRLAKNTDIKGGFCNSVIKKNTIKAGGE